MLSYPCAKGNLVIKSANIYIYGFSEIEFGINFPAGCSVQFLFHWQASHSFTYCFTFFVTPSVRLANSKAGIKPTAPLSVFDKENSIEFLLDSLYYLYNYYMVCVVLSHAYHVTSCDVTLWLPVMWLWLCDTLWHDTFPHFLLCSKSKIKEKKRKRKEKK